MLGGVTTGEWKSYKMVKKKHWRKPNTFITEIFVEDGHGEQIGENVFWMKWRKVS